MEGDTLGTIGMGVGIFGLLIAFMLYKKVDSIEIEDKTVATITGRIQDGAMAFLMAEYRMLAVFIAVVSALLLFGGEENGLGFETMVAFIVGHERQWTNCPSCCKWWPGRCPHYFLQRRCCHGLGGRRARTIRDISNVFLDWPIRW